MRKTLLAATAAFVVGGIATGAVLSVAQPAPPPPAPGLDGQSPHHWMGWGRAGGPGGPGRMMERMRTFALVFPQIDRALGTADVQKIAEAFLLWNGNHTWKVTDVAATPDGPIGFSLTTQEGSVVAKFTMDPHTGRVTRVS